MFANNSTQKYKIINENATKTDIVHSGGQDGEFNNN